MQETLGNSACLACCVSNYNLSFNIQATQGLINYIKLQGFDLGVVSLFLSATISTDFVIF